MTQFQQFRPEPALRVLIVAPTGKDAELTRAVLERAGVGCFCCAHLDDLCSQLVESGAGAILLAEEAFDASPRDRLLAWLSAQPPWSDLPVLVLSRPGADSSRVAEAMELLGNVTVLERPTRVAALVSAVRAALRARQRQYQIREHVAQHERNAHELREADRRKDEFLAILAHELRNPLAPIRNSLQILRMIARDNPTAKRIGEMLERQIGHMVRLVDDLMEVSRITRGKIELRTTQVELATVIRNAVETSLPAIEAGRHHLTVSLPPEPLMLDADPVRLAQVLSNLLNNAARYTESGADGGGQIALSARREQDRVLISVRDTGTGIPADVLPHVFEMFMQGGRSQQLPQGGLGIGLTLVKTLVELHGGSVQAFSEGLGKGSEFVVTLPMAALPALTVPAVNEPTGAAAPSSGTGAGSAPAFPSLHSRRVLVVDDNRDAAESLATVLRLLGASVEVAYDGPSALEALQVHHPAFVLLDIGMPGMDGHEVARRIRARSDLADVRIIALTGWGQEEDRRRSRAAGFDHHLVKPADIGALRSLLTLLEPTGSPSSLVH